VPKSNAKPASKQARLPPRPAERQPVAASARRLPTAKPSPSAHTGAEDDVRITALKLPKGKLSPEMDAYFKKCDEKLGFVPNVLKAFAFDNGKLEAFVEYRQHWCRTPRLSPVEIEMIATAVSSQKRASTAITATEGVRGSATACSAR